MRKVQDHYFKKAKKQGYVARSAFKLEEIDQSNHLFKAGNKVIDLGCFPGSWTQYISKKIGDTGLVVGVDLQELTLPLKSNARFIQCDINELDKTELSAYSDKWDVICSDMAPKTTGIKNVDATRSVQLCEVALFIADTLLRRNGRFLVKIFQGGTFDNFVKTVRSKYQSVKIIKPKSTRSESKEVYVLGMNKKD